MIVSSGDGCIFAFIKGKQRIIIPTIIKLYGAKIVCEVEIASETAPPVASCSASFPGVASARGIDPEKPACQITNPE